MTLVPSSSRGSGAAASVVALAAWPPSSPSDGQLAVLELPSSYDAVGGKTIRWLFSYNLADADWSFLGGPPINAIVNTAETTNGTSYGNLATVGPTLTLPRDGDYEVGVAMVASVVSGQGGYMSYAIGGTAAVDDDALQFSLTQIGAASRLRVKAGLLAADALVGKYRVNAGTDTLTASFRQLTATPLRVT